MEEIISNVSSFINLKHSAFDEVKKRFSDENSTAKPPNYFKLGALQEIDEQSKAIKITIQIYQLVIVQMVWVSAKKLQESYMIYMDFHLQVGTSDSISKSSYQLHFRDYVRSIVDLICSFLAFQLYPA